MSAPPHAATAPSRRARPLVVDARVAFGSGLGRYLRESVLVLSREGGFSEIVLAGDPQELAPFAGTLSGRVRVVEMTGARYALNVPFEWPGIARSAGPDAVSWFPAWDGSPTTPRTVTTVHDLIHFGTPGLGGLVRRTVARAWIGQMVTNSAALVTVSDDAARKIVQHFPRAAGKLTVIPNGVAQVFFDEGARGGKDNPLLGYAGLADVRKPYLLTVANKKEHKNLEMALRTLARLRRDGRTDLTLVMVGDRFAHANRLSALAAELGVQAHVQDLANLTDEQLAALYANAQALLMTSREEGFGLVVLEAMACGAPVVAVDRPPMPEVIKSAGVLVPFDDDAAMAREVERLRTDASARAALIARGHARAAEFTWRASALRLAEVLHGV